MHSSPLLRLTRLGGLSLASAIAGTIALAAAPSDAAAERRTSGLEDQPAVRHRMLLVAKRFELTPMFESTINADFRHIVGGGLKLEYHLSDMLSFGAVGVFSTSLDTGLVGKISPTLEDSVDDMTREPSDDEFLQHLNEMPLHGAAYVSLTPWYGKLAAFGKAFVNFDFYFQAGVSFASLKSNCDSSICDDDHPGTVDDTDPDNPIQPDLNPNNDPPLNDGSRVGLYLGGGIHVFLNEFLALDLTVRDYAFSDNPSGADFDANLYVDDNDSRFMHHLFMGAGLSIMLPTKVKRTP
jgi:outer membrane beta-barrel protein